MNILWCRLHTYPGHSTPSLQLYIFFWITQHNHEPTIYFLIAANHTTDRKQIFTPTGVGIGAAFRIEPLCCLSVCPLFGFFSLTPLCCMRPPWSSFGSVICFCRYNWYSFFFLMIRRCSAAHVLREILRRCHGWLSLIRRDGRKGSG